MLIKFRNAIEELGWVNALLYLVDRAFFKLGLGVRISRCIYLAQPVPKESFLRKGRGESIEVRQLDTNDEALASLPLAPDILAARRRNPKVACFGAFKGGELIGCHWLTLGTHDDEQFRVRYQSKPRGYAVWDFDIYLVPEQRSGLAFARLWDNVFAFLRERGVGWSMSYVLTTNRDSQVAHQVLGARPIGGALFIQSGGWQLMFSNIPPFVHLSTGPGSRPEVRLSPPAVDTGSPARE